MRKICSNAIVHPLANDDENCLTRERRRDAELLRRHLKNLKKIQDGRSSLPGPEEAKQCMLSIEKHHMMTQAARLKLEALDASVNIREAKKLVRKIAAARKTGKIDCKLGATTMKMWCQVAAEIREKRLHEQALVDIDHRRLLSKIQLRESEYRREVVESHLPHCLRMCYNTARFPCSPWWNEYLHCIAGKQALRRAPPRPEFRCQDYLEAVEERYKRSIVADYDRVTKCVIEQSTLPPVSRDYRPGSTRPPLARGCQDFLEAAEDRYRRSLPTDYSRAVTCPVDILHLE